ncbi:PAAR domain-containing protein [Pseudomonas sp. UBA4194]|uniref:PAAR domain-containing protein n=1 Tax=Pseudomonas sp. UBA4194 TaxID=1947317 RepID=UPI0025EBAEBA|nr:PAAR domain-containing protein [Pseudomonas sp. UBA4194]
MNGIIRIGDLLSSGGLVVSGSSAMRFAGIGVARKGDEAVCPLPGHGHTVIVEGHPTFHEDGVPIAFHGHRCACGCTLISSLPQACAR